jgi:hypothetical protein
MHQSDWYIASTLMCDIYLYGASLAHLLPINHVSIYALLGSNCAFLFR